MCSERSTEYITPKVKKYSTDNTTMKQWQVNIPEGTSGAWTIQKFTVSATDAKFESMRAAFNGGRGVPEGSYTRLTYRDNVIMSDTPDEMRDHLTAIYEAHRRGGNILVNGLGLGMVAQAMLEKNNVETVTVIELSSDVISLVAPHLDKRITVINADAYTWTPPKGAKYTVAWHDIWPDLCTDNLEEMSKLHRKYGRRCGWQGSWGKELLQYHKRREQKRENRWGW